ncbi:MAG TPA: replication-relaxation family protein [Candidatus Paceibacterota bacterium]|nr:replication-relaxation family protein [Candidatus Paceibacterota bacterium]
MTTSGDSGYALYPMGALRQSKFTRSAARSSVRIGAYQIDIVDAVYRFRYLTAPQIAAVLDRHPDSVKRAVRGLYDARYLLRPRCQRDPAPWQTTPIYHAISAKGAELLREERGYNVPKNGFDAKESQEHIANWRHDTALSEFLVKLLVDVRKEGQLELLFPRDLLERGIIAPDVPWQPYAWKPLQWSTAKGTVVPDQAVMFQDPGRPEGQNRSLLLIELDRGTEAMERVRNDSNTIRGKLEKYIAAYGEGKHTETFGVRNMRVAFVTTSQQRIHGMQRLLYDMGVERRMFLFSTIKETRECVSLLALSWADNRGDVAYLTRIDRRGSG